MIRILIADDHAIVRRGLRAVLLEEFAGAKIVEVGDTESLLAQVRSQEWDVVITDISMPGRNGLEAISDIKETYPKLPVLVLSVHSEDHYALRALKAGAAGYLMKKSASEELVNAVNKALRGKKYITSSIAEKLASSFYLDSKRLPHEVLSDREFEVFKMVALGNSVSEIAKILNLSATTVSTYRSRILIKMQIKTNAGLTQYAMENKII